MQPSTEPLSASAPEVAHGESLTGTQMEHPSGIETIQETQADMVEDADEESRLKFLTTGTRDQVDLERDIGRQADQLLMEQADERDKKRMAKTELDIKRAEAAIAKLRNRLHLPIPQSARLKVQGEITEYQKKIETLDQELDSIQQRINERHKADDGKEDEAADGVNQPRPNESRRDFLIRTGKITPFSKLAQTSGDPSSLGDVMRNAEIENEVDEVVDEETVHGPISHQNLMKPGFGDETSSSEAPSPPSKARPSKRRRITRNKDEDLARETSSAPETPASDSEDAYIPDLNDRELAALDESEDISDELLEDESYDDAVGRKRKARAPKSKKKLRSSSEEVQEQEDLTGIDDGNEKVYQSRLLSWSKSRAAARRRAHRKQGHEVVEQEEDEEFYLPHPTQADKVFGEDFRIPGDIFPALFDYQKTGVQWLWELYAQNVGGIIGDEMGLGKTIQAISFIAGLHYSKKLTKPVIVVCPATVMKQWVNEFHTWWPALRVSILHSSGSGMLNTRREDQMEREMELRGYGNYDHSLTKAGKAAKRIVERVKRDGHVLVTTYSGLQTYGEFLLPTNWECAVLDEGHKIRNPNTSITIHCKQLLTPNRIILSGTPMQNNLTELWSLFDFVFPMRLGTLVSFRSQFEFPIKQGGYANASNLAFETAMRCAETLKDAISPYLLQRFKKDVAADLPPKKEHVLFCKLTVQQRTAYENFLGSDEMKSIEEGKRQMLYGVDWLRKVCNHPDLTDHKRLSKDPTYNYGAANKSGKMQVVKELLSMWKKGGHKTLLFAQHRIMLNILEKYIKKLPGFNYLRMDGETPINRRQDLVDQFNNDPEQHVFLLTTKVGGLGVNLTGADRVIIYDPDWNPATDAQAQERSWRLGQKREVEIFRLMCAGTLEEKIYHRQIFKQFLANKVLKDPKQRQQFQMSDLHDLFTLGSARPDGETETGELFRGSEAKFDDNAGLNRAKIPTPPSDSLSSKSKQPNTDTTQEELSGVAGISYTEQFRVPKEPSGNEEEAEGADQSDNHLMSTIFARSGVQSVLEHDAVINANTSGRKRKVRADPAFIQREAKKEAAKAAEALRKAEQDARRMPIGVPTWTGEYGEAGRPEERPAQRGHFSGRGGRGGRGGPSSTAILNNLAVRQGRTSTPNQSRDSTPTPSAGTSMPSGYRGRQMLEKIRAFMITHGGVVPTQMLIDHFDHYCREVPGRNELFKEILRLVCRMERGSATRARWVLKEEWRDVPAAGAGRGAGGAGRA